MSALEVEDAVSSDLARATGLAEAAEESSKRLNRVLQLTGFSDPVYAEAYVTVHQYDIVLDVTVLNRWGLSGGARGQGGYVGLVEWWLFGGVDRVVGSLVPHLLGIAWVIDGGIKAEMTSRVAWVGGIQRGSGGRVSPWGSGWRANWGSFVGLGRSDGQRQTGVAPPGTVLRARVEAGHLRGCPIVTTPERPPQTLPACPPHPAPKVI